MSRLAIRFPVQKAYNKMLTGFVRVVYALQFLSITLEVSRTDAAAATGHRGRGRKNWSLSLKPKPWLWITGYLLVKLSAS